jgi:hypothetical protein
MPTRYPLRMPHSLRAGRGRRCAGGYGSRVACVVLAMGASLCACLSPRSYARDPSTTGDSPNVTKATTAEARGVAYCPGGQRAQACLLGANCRVTEQGCQVCQCLSPEGLP